MANEFFPTTCNKCGVTDEARFTYASPHIKQVCNACGFYVKFFNVAQIPDVRTICEKIWFISGQRTDVIELAKQEAEFVPGATGLAAKMMWWRVYLAVRTKAIV